jgi:hypothetical protein
MASTNPTNLERQLLDWADKPATARYYRDGQIQQIEAALADPRRTTQLSIGAWMLGTWHLGCGQARVLRSDLTGWDDIRLGVMYQRTSLLIRARRVVKATRQGDVPDLPVLQAANCTAMGLSVGDPDGELLYEAFRTLPDACFGDNDSWPLFVRELLNIRAGERPVVTPRLGIYSEVLLGWNDDPALFARRLQAILDHHLQSTRGQPGEPAIFEEPGMLLYPAEVLAVRRIRTDLEMNMPKVEHALMFSNLVQSAARGPWPVDPLLTRLQHELRRDMRHSGRDRYR